MTNLASVLYTYFHVQCTNDECITMCTRMYNGRHMYMYMYMYMHILSHMSSPGTEDPEKVHTRGDELN